MNNNDIDIVIPWVNSTDEVWFEKYKEASLKYKGDKDPQRIRDFGLFKYWLRSVAENASWIRKIHLLLDSKTQIPNWLNTNNEKIEIHYHKDFIDEEYLPSFNSNIFFAFCYKLKNLTENFIYLNDDIFIMNKTSPDDFFKDGKPIDTSIKSLQINANPVDEFWLNKMHVKYKPNQKYNFFHQIVFNDIKLAEKYTGKFNIYKNVHVGITAKKSEVEKIFKELDKDLRKYNKPDDKFRQSYNVNCDWLYRYIRLNLGNFSDSKLNDFAYIESHNNNYKEIYKLMQVKKILCINDCLNKMDSFDFIKKYLNELFSIKFPNKSEFEI